VTFTGSIVAFLKLAGRMSSKPIRIPGPRHLLNSSLLGLNVATMGTFLAMAPGSPLIAACCLAGNAVLSFLKGYTTTAAIGGADMREFLSAYRTNPFADTLSLDQPWSSQFSMPIRASPLSLKVLCWTTLFSQQSARSSEFLAPSFRT